MELAEARALVRVKTDKDITVRHLISVEGVMRALARRLGEDQDRWALAGLFHDLDQDQTGEDLSHSASLSPLRRLVGAQHVAHSRPRMWPSR
jgi:putative nucleotidyltransferase with HDIG domain